MAKEQRQALLSDPEQSQKEEKRVGVYKVIGIIFLAITAPCVLYTFIYLINPVAASGISLAAAYLSVAVASLVAFASYFFYMSFFHFKTHKSLGISLLIFSVGLAVTTSAPFLIAFLLKSSLAPSVLLIAPIVYAAIAVAILAIKIWNDEYPMPSKARLRYAHAERLSWLKLTTALTLTVVMALVLAASCGKFFDLGLSNMAQAAVSIGGVVAIALIWIVIYCWRSDTSAKSNVTATTPLLAGVARISSLDPPAPSQSMVPAQAPLRTAVQHAEQKRSSSGDADRKDAVVGRGGDPRLNLAAVTADAPLTKYREDDHRLLLDPKEQFRQ